MKQAIETGKDKVKKICEVLRKETLEPAMEEADRLLVEAKEQAAKILEEAKKQSSAMVTDAEKEIEKRQGIFQAALSQGARQSIEWLKQEIDGHLINQKLSELIAKETSQANVIADMVQAVIKAVRDEGLDSELSAVIPSAVSPDAINKLLGSEILASLKEKSVVLGPMKGGIEVKLHKNNITIDLTDSALLDLMTRYVKKDFHKYFFEK